MTAQEIYDDILRQLNNPQLYFPPELVISFINRAMRKTVDNVKCWWLRFDKDIGANIGVYKLDTETLGFRLRGIRSVFYNENTELKPDRFNYLLRQTAVGRPSKYALMWEEDIPIIILRPIPNEDAELNMYGKGYFPINRITDNIRMPEFTHELVQIYTEFLVYETFGEKQKMILRKNDYEVGIKALNEEWIDKIPAISEKTEIIYLPWDE